MKTRKLLIFLVFGKNTEIHGFPLFFPNSRFRTLLRGARTRTTVQYPETHHGTTTHYPGYHPTTHHRLVYGYSPADGLETVRQASSGYSTWPTRAVPVVTTVYGPICGARGP